MYQLVTSNLEVGPVADTFEDAVEQWYLTRCQVNAWSNEDQGFSCAEHEHTADAKLELHSLYQEVEIEASGERICVVPTPKKVKVDVNPPEWLQHVSGPITVATFLASIGKGRDHVTAGFVKFSRSGSPLTPITNFNGTLQPGDFLSITGGRNYYVTD